MRHYALLIRLVSATLAITMLFVACDRTGSKPSGQPEKVIIAYAALPETALAQIAESRGYFGEEGLEATVRSFSYGKLALTDLLQGNADFATVAETPVMFSIINGEKIGVIATIQSSTRNHAIVARKDKAVLTPQDLKGKRIATTLGITADYFMDAFLATHKISRKEITIVNLRPEEHQDALVNGRVDALSTFYPFLKKTQDTLGARGITFYDRDIYTETFHVVAKQDYISNNTEKVRKVLRALLKAEAFAAQHPAEAQKIVADFSRTDAGIISAIWADNDFEVSLDQKLVLALEDESRWAIKNRLTTATKAPNFLDHISLDGLKSVRPEAVRIVR